MKNICRSIVILLLLSLILTGCQNQTIVANHSNFNETETSQNSKTPSPEVIISSPTIEKIPTLTASPEQQRDLMLGLEGADVQKLENQLLSLGYSEIGLVDSSYDLQDEAGVKHFQLLNNLPITGIVDEATLTSLENSSPAPYYLPPAFPGKVTAVSSTTPVCDDHALQDRLAVSGYLQPGSEEWSIGAFGPESKAALVEFQKSVMKSANGIPDLETWKILFSPIPHWSGGSAETVVEKWDTSIYPADQNMVAIAWDGSRLWMAVSKGNSIYENYLIRIDPGEHPAEAVMVIRPRDCETEYAQIENMIFAGGKIWLLYATDKKGFPIPLLQTIEPDTGIARSPFQFAKCPDDFCFYSSGLGSTKGQIWAAGGDRAYQIDPSTGKVVLSRPVGFLATGKMVFDGQCYWYQGEASVLTFNPLGGKCRVDESITSLLNGIPETNGVLVWTINYDGSLTQINLNTGVSIVLDTGFNSPTAMVYGNNHLWIADASTNSVIGLDPESGSFGDPIPLSGEYPIYMLQESNNLWVYFQNTGTVQKVDIENYQIVPIFRTATPVFTATPSPTPPVLVRSLSLSFPNMRGEDVLMLQNKLLSLGYTELGLADGIFGNLTDKAVRRFQQENGLTVDGIVGPLTWNKIFTP